MNTIYKKLFATVLSAVMITSTVYADFTAVQTDDTTVEISGIVEESKEEKNIIVNVLAPNTSYDMLLSAESTSYGDILVYHNQGETDANGKFEFEINMSNKPSGLYKAYSSYNSEGVDLVYTDKDANKAEVQWLASLTGIPTVEEFDAKQADLGFYNSIFSSADKTEVLALIWDAIENKKLEFTEVMTDFDKRNIAIAVFNKAVVISCLNDDKIENLFEYSDLAGLENSSIGEFLDLSFVTKGNFATTATDKLSDKDFATNAEFDAALQEAFILSAVRYPDGYNNLTGLLNHFAKDIGIKKTVTASISSSISGNSYNSTKDLAEAINEMESKPSSSGGSSGGGSFGGGFSGGNTLIVDNNIIKTESPKELPVDIFTDLENVPWAKEAIVYLAEMGVLVGDGSSNFYPERFVTREEFTKMVVETFFPDSEEVAVSFVDVTDDDWFAPYVRKAKGLGIINGKSEELFGAGERITRQDMATIAYNAMKLYGVNFKTDSPIAFADDNMIADYARDGVYSLKADGIINGIGNNIFAPLDNATRAEAAKILYGLLEM